MTTSKRCRFDIECCEHVEFWLLSSRNRHVKRQTTNNRHRCRNDIVSMSSFRTGLKLSFSAGTCSYTEGETRKTISEVIGFHSPILCWGALSHLTWLLKINRCWFDVVSTKITSFQRPNDADSSNSFVWGRSSRRGTSKEAATKLCRRYMGWKRGVLNSLQSLYTFCSNQ